jgi:hypothetical protein
MKYAVEMGSGAMMYVPSLIKIGSVIQKFIVWGGGGEQRQQGDLMSLLYERRLKIGRDRLLAKRNKQSKRMER